MEWFILLWIFIFIVIPTLALFVLMLVVVGMIIVEFIRQLMSIPSVWRGRK